ncbi:helix-turn-helix domain-containing protein [Olivibacter domesticus]|uniref:Helix-turn-helix domain-containing protein n=1 Tax=Olivibacter domesticus TaxID=407022 RepID=A0A1H7GXG6_OLID1|nr:helix-turn-helix domain-containing protein [Olivibacter domesticus]SEK42719.1 Helix-turn-helix domain-containing protein [Olivibacter domesticus]
MEYKEIKPHITLVPYIHSFWELKGDENDGQWERIFPDGCPGLVINLGETCLTDNGSVAMDFGQTFVVGAMTSFKDSFVNANTHLVGVCLKPAAFSNFYSYAPQNELINSTIAFDKRLSFDIEKISKDTFAYLNKFFSDRIRDTYGQLYAVLEDIHHAYGQLSVYEIAKRNCTTVRQLERHFKTQIGVTPKEYSNIIRFQRALSLIKNTGGSRSLLDIAFESGFYDHAHLANEIKRNTGLTPSEL